MSLVVEGKSLRPYFTKLDQKFCFIGLGRTYVLANGSKGTDREKRKASRPETVHGPEVWSHDVVDVHHATRSGGPHTRIKDKQR